MSEYAFWSWRDCSYHDDSQHKTKIFFKTFLDHFRPDTPDYIIELFKGSVDVMIDRRVDFEYVNNFILKIHM